MSNLKNIHPGEILLEEFLKPLEISAYRLSKDTFIPQTRISEIIIVSILGKLSSGKVLDIDIFYEKYLFHQSGICIRHSSWASLEIPTL